MKVRSVFFKAIFPIFLFVFTQFSMGLCLKDIVKMEKTDPQKSLSLLKRYLKMHPENTWGYFQLAILDKKLNEDIKDRENSTFFYGPKDKFFFYVGIRKVLEKNYLSAINFLERAIKENDKNPVYFEIYLDIINEFDFKDRALKFFFTFNKKNCEILSAISEVYLYKNDYKNFKKYLNEITRCEKKGKNISIFLLKCQDLAFRNHFGEAIKNVKNEIKYYEKLNDSQNLAYLHLLLGTLYFFKYKYTNSYREFLTALKLCDGTPNVYLKDSILSSLADYYINIDYFSEAEKTLKVLLHNVEVFGGVESEIDIYMKLGDLYEGIGDFYNSIYYYNKALDFAHRIKDDLNYTLILFRLGDMELNFKDYMESKKYYKMGMKNKNIITLYRLEPSLYSGLGEIYEGLGKRKIAIKYYKMAIEYSKKNNDYSTLAYLYLVLSTFYSNAKDEKGIKYAKKAYKLYKQLGLPEDQKNSVLSIAYAFYLNGQYKKSISWLKKLYLVSRDTSDFSYAFISSGLLGKCYKKLGNLKESLFYFEKSRYFIDKISRFLLPSINYKLDFESSVHKIFEEYIDTCYQLFKKDKDVSYLEKSFKISEEYKSSNFFFLYFKNKMLAELKNIPPETKLKFYVLDKKIDFLRGKYLISKNQSDKILLKNQI